MAASEIEALHRAAGDVYPLGSTTLTELSGGLKSGDVINLVGPAASGKTEICIATAVATVQRRDAHVLLFTSQPVHLVVQRLVAVALASTKACLQREGVSEPGALQDALCSLLPGGPQHQLGQRMAVMIVDSMTDMLPSWHTAASKRSRFSAQASAAAVGRLTRLVACSCHCAVLTTSTSQPMKPHAAQVSQAIIPRFAGGSADWDTFAAAVAGRFPAAGGAGQWMQEAAGAARWAQQAANSQPHVQFMDATVRLHVWRSTGGSGASFSAACTADEALQAAAVRSPSHAAKAKTAWSISTCIIGRTHAASASNARLSSMHVGSGVDGARAGVLQLPLAVAALAAGDIAAALLGPDENAIATWHAQEWHESLLDMGVAVGCVDKAGVQPPVMPTANSVTQAAAAWSARKSKNTYEPPRLSSRQGKFARVGAPALGSVVPPGKGFWAMRAAALGLLWGLQGDV